MKTKAKASPEVEIPHVQIRENLHRHLDEILFPGYVPNMEYTQKVAARLHKFFRELKHEVFFTITGFKADGPCRVRMYIDNKAAAEDITRPPTSTPEKGKNVGIIFDVVVLEGHLDWHFTPVIGVNSPRGKCVMLVEPPIPVELHVID